MCGKVFISSLGFDQTKEELLPELESIFSLANHGSHMYQGFLVDMKSRSQVFRLFLAYIGSTLSGVAVVVEDKNDDETEHYGHQPVYLKRFAVLPELRGNGIGKLLLDATKCYAFDTLGLLVLFGKSNTAGAFSFYGREGALYSGNDIRTYSRRNTEEQNLLFFSEFISNPIFRLYRYPEGKGIPFIFTVSHKERLFFEQRGYISKAELLKRLKT